MANPPSRKRRPALHRLRTILILSVLVLLATPPLVSAVQNIFTGLGTAKDIKYGGKNVNQVVYRGQVVWEREPDLADGTAMQSITSANCPTNRIRAYDARDNHSYYIQKLADGKCWMLTNLAYAGGGDETYGDTTDLPVATTSGYFGGSSANAYATKGWAEPGGTMYTTEPTNPSLTTGADGQHGYFYNWCAAMGGQATACQRTAATQPNQGANIGSGANTNYNICPKGWRLPTGSSSGEFRALTNAIGTTSSNMRNTWLGVYAGIWDNSPNDQGSNGYYWSSTAASAPTVAYGLNLTSSSTDPAHFRNKYYGYAVRCIAG